MNPAINADQQNLEKVGPLKQKHRFATLRRFRHSFKFSSLNSSKDERIFSFKGYLSLYRYATPCDTCMLLVSAIAAFASGTCVPIMAIEFGKLVKSMVLHPGYRKWANFTVFSCNGLANPRMVQDRQPQAVIQDFLTVFSTVAGIYVALSAIYFSSWYISAEKQATRWAKAYFKGLLEKDLEWFDTHGTHDYPSESIENLSVIRQGIGVQIPFCISLLSTFFQSVSFVVWEAYPALQFSLSAIFIVPIMACLQLLVVVYAAKEAVGLTRAVIPVVEFAEEVIRGIQTVMAYNGQKAELDRFKREQRYLIKGFRCETLLYSLLVAIFGFILPSFCAVIFWKSFENIWDQRKCRKAANASDAVSIETIFSSFLSVAIGMIDVWLFFPILESCRLAETSGSRVAYIIDNKSARKSFGTEGYFPPHFHGKVEFEEVRFAFPNNKDVMVLNNLSFTLQPGWRVGFVGLKGVEFSVIFALLQRHYLPDSGFIKLDNHDIRNLNRSWYVRQIGYFSNNPMLFHDTIEQNIRKANPDATQSDIEEACVLAQVHSSIIELPSGYQTYVGENGSNLPQIISLQIALARTLIQKPKILIFDEPTAELDGHCATELISILDQISKGKTTLWIPHYFRTLLNADMIYVIEKGQVIEQGTYSQLIKHRGMFYFAASKMDTINEKGKKWGPRRPSVLYRDKDLFLPPPRFLLPVYNAGLCAYPDPIAVKANWAWMENKYTGIRAQQMTLEVPLGLYKTLYEKSLSPEDEVIMKADNSDKDSEWKHCNVRDDNHFAKVGSEEEKATRKGTKDRNAFSWCTVLNLAVPSTSIGLVCVGSVSCVMLGLLTPACGFALAKAVQILQEMNENKAKKHGDELFLYMIVTGCLLSVLLFVRTISLGAASLRSFRVVQKRLFTRIIRQEKAWFDKPWNNSDTLSIRLSRDVGAVSYITRLFFKLVLQDGIAVLSCIVVTVLTDLRLSSWCLFLAPVSIAIALIDGLLLSYFDQVRTERMRGRLRTVTVDLFNNRQTVSALHLEHYFLNRLEYIIQTHQSSSRLFDVVRGLAFGISQGGVFLLYAVYLAVVAKIVKPEAFNFPVVLLVGHLLVYEMWRMGTGFVVIPSLKRSFSRGANVLKITKRHPRVLLDAGFAKDFKGSVHFQDVHFWLKDFPHKQILKGVSFKAEPGQTIALIGTAGSGKSICPQLILRMYDAMQGKVEVDGSDIRLLNCFQLRRQIAFLDQEPLLFERTVRENIAYGDNSRTIELSEVIKAAKKANIHKFICSLPRRYDTVIGPTNTILTFAQKQRISMARIFIKNPKILIIDEPTTSLESETEKKILSSEAKLKYGRTCIILARRIKTVEAADLVFVFQDGVIKQWGNHSQLLSSGGLYKLVYEAQGDGKEFFEAVTLIGNRALVSSKHMDKTYRGPEEEEETNSQLDLIRGSAGDDNAVPDGDVTLTYADLAQRIIDHFPRIFD